ncbi:M28 family metallopeptidase [Maribacter polysiphoniae]|uniref:M28 family metallopeptidase n=1 Tax=Maribacter polysiphoniae TaxID=429344 RepID=UPI002354D9D5|nr:M20/M25/M40 family metallo-hydrolase [Maribacter polysiphoniae]
MKKIIQFVFVLLLFGCGATQSKSNGDSGVPSGPSGVKGSVVASNIAVPGLVFTNSDSVGKIIGFLASDELNGRDAGSPGIEKAAQYIEGVFSRNGIQPFFGTFRDTLDNSDKPMYNIVGVLEGTDPDLKDEFILIGAHYDHIGTSTPVNGDAIANGANDNASGTTTVLEMLRYFAQAKTNKRSLVFAFFTAEEKGLWGSRHLAKRLKENDFNLYTMLNFEMVGVPMVDKDYLAYVTGYGESNMAEVCNTYAQGNIVGFLPSAKEFNLFMRSDNFPFHKEFNVPSQTFSTFDFTNFDHYHKVGDEVSEMDFDHMATLINTFIPVVADIANATEQEIKYN